MYQAIKSKWTLLTHKIKIAMLKHKINSMSRDTYLSLWDRIELRNATDLLKNLEYGQRS